MSTDLVVPNRGALHSAGLGTLVGGAGRHSPRSSSPIKVPTALSFQACLPLWGHPLKWGRGHFCLGNPSISMSFYRRNFSLVSCSDCTLPVSPSGALDWSSVFWDPKSGKGVSLTLFCFPSGTQSFPMKGENSEGPCSSGGKKPTERDQVDLQLPKYLFTYFSGEPLLKHTGVENVVLRWYCCCIPMPFSPAGSPCSGGLVRRCLKLDLWWTWCGTDVVLSFCKHMLLCKFDPNSTYVIMI